MKREQAYIVVGVLLVLLTIGGIYQFYFKGLLDQYSQNIARRELLRTRLVELASTDGFSGYRPASLVSAWRGYIQPWTDALESRASYYRIDEVVVDPVPEGKIPKFHYAEEFDKRVLNLRTYAYSRNPPCQIPADLYGYFGVPTPDSIVARSVTSQEVVTWLQQFERGAQLLRLFIDAGAETIQEFHIWPVRTEHDGTLEMYTVGALISIRMERLAQFLDDLQRANRYISVDGLSIENSNLISWYDPSLQVRMLLTQAKLPAGVVPDSQAATAAAEPGRGGPPPGMSLREYMRQTLGATEQSAPPVPEGSGFSRWWKDFRRAWLPF